MPEHKDGMGFRDQMHAVLRGPDGAIKEERTNENIKQEVENNENDQE